jgi:hypothetical protein
MNIVYERYYITAIRRTMLDLYVNRSHDCYFMYLNDMTTDVTSVYKIDFSKNYCEVKNIYKQSLEGLFVQRY